MKRPSQFSVSGSIDAPAVRPRGRMGFTLVELLVVITIIGILAGLITAAALNARITAKNAAVTMELKQLEMACQMYKEKYGEYPPDFSGIGTTAGNAIISRHIARAFPRYTRDWKTDILDALATNSGITKLEELTPETALVFWLGGIPDADGQLQGFAANPSNPFLKPGSGTGECASRIRPFFDFDTNRISKDASGKLTYKYWPQNATGDMTTGAIVYFRAENNNYTEDGTTSGTIKSFNELVFPAADWKSKTTSPYVWVNPKAIQIFSSGLDSVYTAPTDYSTDTKIPVPLQFPNGDNYGNNTFDDITNFSGGTLESKMED